MAVWDLTGEPFTNVSGFPRIEDSTFVFCDVTTLDIQRIEALGTKERFWIKFGSLIVETELTTVCNPVKQYNE